MKITKVSAVPMSAPVPKEKRHRTDLGTKVKSDATLIRVETDNGLTGIGAALGSAADRRGHRRARAGARGRRRGPDVLRAHLREDVQRFAEHAGARAWGDASRRKPATRRHHGSDCRRRHRGVGREGAGARHSALPGARRGAPLGARLRQRRLGARRGGRGGAGGLCGQGLYRSQDARGRPRRVLHSPTACAG